MVEQQDPVDAQVMDEWEADRRSRFGTAMLCWAWYLPTDLIRSSAKLRSAAFRARRLAPLLRYPLIRAADRRASTQMRMPVHRR